MRGAVDSDPVRGRSLLGKDNLRERWMGGSAGLPGNGAGPLLLKYFVICLCPLPESTLALQKTLCHYKNPAILHRPD